MKIRIKKKQVLLFSIILILILVFFILFLYERYSLNTSNYTLDRYKELTESCSSKGLFGGISYKCTAILERYEKKDGNDCFYFSVTKNSSSIKRFTICEKENSFNWDKNILITEKQVPIYINLKYRGISFFGYRLNSIEFTLLEDAEIYALLDTLERENITFSNIRINSIAKVEELGYYPSNDLVLSEGKYIKRIFIYLGEIKNVRVENSDLVFDSIFKIGGQEYSTKLSGSNIGYENWLKGKTQDLNISNYTNYELIGKVQAMFFYIDGKSNVTNSDLVEYCNSGNIDFDSIALCSIPRHNNIREFKIDDIDAYFRDVIKGANDFNIRLDKLIFAYLGYK